MKSLRELFRIGKGPSSSHSMGPAYACRYVKELYPNCRYKVFLYGSLALTGKGHLTDEVIKEELGENTEVIFDVDKKVGHPNTMEIEIIDVKKTFRIISIGGGEILIDGKIVNSNASLYPFKTFDDIKKYSIENNLTLPEIVYKIEGEEIKDYLYEVYTTMVDSINRGLTSEGVLPGRLHVSRKAKAIFDDSVDELDKVMAYAYAVAEENACGHIVVTAPTCGACGIVPATLYYLCKKHNISKEKVVDLLAVAGLLGNVIKYGASLSGAFMGCQAEVGSATSMAAGMIASYYSNDLEKIECASEIAMEHSLGLTCDPVEGYVQIPCIERNAIFALKALSAARLSLHPIYPEKISFDTVVKTMKETGMDIKEEYKETSKAGLAKNKI